MPHADTAHVPAAITTKAEFWPYVRDQLDCLLEDGNWVSNLANAAALLYTALASRSVNWCGFYLLPSVFPSRSTQTDRLLLGPFCGKPACQFIPLAPPRGVCARAYTARETIVVPDVDAFPDHIACDGDTKSEIVVPLTLQIGTVLGVLDIDALVPGGFDDEDRRGLEAIADLIVARCDWDW